jgi:Domain of unknown function (DUF222)/HNH endonuclease
MHDEDALVRYALDATAPDVEERCRQIRNVHPDSVHEARRAWEARSLSAWRNATRGTLCMRVELPIEVGELVMQAIERALEQEEVPDGVAERSPSAFQSQLADALVAMAKAYLHGGATDSTASSPSTADHCQVVIHVDEAALHGGAGRSDAPLETVKRLACDASLVVVTEDERGTPLSVGRKQRVVSTPIRRAVLARDRHCTFPGCHRTRFVEAHHVHHWAEGGETSVDNLVLLCSYHHRLLHEGGYRIRRDHQGEHYFVLADGRAIPRCGYRAKDFTDDFADDQALENPLVEGQPHKEVDRANPSVEVRETCGVYRLRPQRRAFLV